MKAMKLLDVGVKKPYMEPKFHVIKLKYSDLICTSLEDYEGEEWGDN